MMKAKKRDIVISLLDKGLRVHEIAEIAGCARVYVYIVAKKYGNGWSCTKERINLLRELASEGLGASQIAKEFCVTRQAVYQLAKAHDIKFKPQVRGRLPHKKGE